ncbi:MAG: prephenate dehydrogenase, partial [Hyphomicrobiaceae bacterium]|nr:prephenate dehydrogenase [Hyphomicrobiaceae bacterium]
MPTKNTFTSVGILGFGAFGRLIARHLHRHFRIVACDPGVPDANIRAAHADAGGLSDVGACDIVILAVPVTSLTLAIRQIRPFLRPGCLVIDVGSVKVSPARVMLAELPPDVEILGTHPLFGPQSAHDGIAGRKIAICPLRCRSTRRVAAFLHKALGLDVHVTTPEEHDR